MLAASRSGAGAADDRVGVAIGAEPQGLAGGLVHGVDVVAVAQDAETGRVGQGPGPAGAGAAGRRRVGIGRTVAPWSRQYPGCTLLMSIQKPPRRPRCWSHSGHRAARHRYSAMLHIGLPGLRCAVLLVGVAPPGAAQVRLAVRCQRRRGRRGSSCSGYWRPLSVRLRSWHSSTPLTALVPALLTEWVDWIAPVL